ncbi:MBL fold metallo-hydrolase [Larkinella rosea]|uniref:MBL fold metallo-hydrolase n=1 Tax=Larkinella rosea TaxID=2025312 RepID=A0A3P1BMF6_9BACT|nr:MBL fold metallo-hydrolase [Larkinella rosea]RRB02232.1 MBL fold metallo-hydrolase [Larkinella rosea]
MTLNDPLICTTCGTQYPPHQPVPELCTICNDDRQYIPENGQNWTTLPDLEKTYTVKISPLTDRIHSLKMQPDFAIANRALLVQSPGGNILWDCIPLPDAPTVALIRSMGGLKAIAFSHPHYYSTMNVWASLFDCPVYIHENDQPWIMYPSDSLQLWSGDSLSFWDGIRMIHTGGHFPGSCVLHIPSSSDRGTLLCGDTLLLSRSKRHLAVMFSYPNQILLTRDEFVAFYKKAENLAFDSLYGAFENQDLTDNIMAVFTKSMQRYWDSYGL